jgi:protein phosphatase
MLRVADHSARSDKGRQRPGNEDNYHVRVPLFVVADGMGGAQAGEVASKTAVEVFQHGLPNGPGSEEERLAGLVARANARIHELAQGDDQRAGMGTTLTAAYMGEEDLAVAHVGDSRLYVLRDGQLEQRTDDHSLVGELVRRGELSAQEAEEHPQRSIITRALGPEGEVAVDHYTWPVRDGDVYLLCSDGLTSMIPDTEIAEILTGTSSLEEATARLIRSANDAGGRDNITVVLFRVEDVSPGSGALEAPTREEQATGAGGTALRTEEVRRAVAEAPPAARAARSEETAVRAPQPRRDEPSPGRERGRRRWIAPLVVLLILLAMVGSAGWIASRGVYFVGTDDQGFVTLYQGLPYELPGVSLYQDQFTSGVPAQQLPPAVRSTVTEHKLRSHDDAIDLVRQLERGTLAGQS